MSPNSSSNPTDYEHEDGVIVDDVWAVTSDGTDLTYRLADHTPQGGYGNLAAKAGAHNIDAEAVLESLRGTGDHRVIGRAALDADSGDVLAFKMAADAPTW